MSPALVATSPPESTKEDYENTTHVESQIIFQKGVKHLCENIGVRNVPGKYILPVSERPNYRTLISGKPHTTAGTNFELPVIDFSQLQLQGSNRDRVLVSLAKACETYGFFQLVNHGISDEVISNMMKVSKNFFELPCDEREKYMTADMERPVRYGTSFNQTKDGVYCWRDFLKLVCNPQPGVLSHWPASPVDFRELAVTYANETKILFEKLADAILEGLLGLGTTTTTTRNCTEESEKKKKTNNALEEDDELIVKELKDGSQLMVVNCFPQCPEPDLTLGMPPHSDYGFLTLVLQDEVAGLQMQHQGKWVTIEPIPGSFVVNVGDHLEIFSNGKYKSVLHRVFVNSIKSRISVASLHSFPFKTMIRPSTQLINDTNPRRYKDTDFATFLQYIQSCDPKDKTFLESRKLIR